RRSLKPGPSPRYTSTTALTGHFLMTAVNLHHRITGTGQPLDMLHGLFGSQENLGAISRLLAEQYQIHGLDLRNHGRSPHTQAYSYPLMVADVIAYMDRIGLERAHFIGHSMGGKTAMQLALTQDRK